MAAGYLLAYPLTAKEEWLRIGWSGADQLSAVDSRIRDEVLTDAGEAKGRAALLRLAELHAARLPGRSPLPIRVILFASRQGFTPYGGDSNTGGRYLSGPDRDTIVLFAQGELTHQVLAHEYMHARFFHGAPPMRRSLEEGLADFFSTVQTSKNRALVGLPVAGHVALLASTPARFTPAELAAAHHGSFQGGDDRGPLFYAQSWSVAQALIVAINGGRLFSRQADAWEGRAVVRAAPSEALAARCESLLAMGNHEEARALVAKVRRGGKTDRAQADAALAMIALQENNLEEAAKLLERSLRAQPEASSAFEYAMLLRDSGRPASEVDFWLARTLEMNPSNGEALLISGVRAGAAGRGREAVELLTRASRVLPRRSAVWHALAYAQHLQGLTAEARLSAAWCLAAAEDGGEREMAESLRALIESAEAGPAVRGSRTLTPGSWNLPTPQRTAEGVLRRVICFGDAATLEVETSSGVLMLWAGEPDRVRVTGVPGIRAELACGAHREPVKAGYRESGSRRVLMTLEFTSPQMQK